MLVHLALHGGGEIASAEAERGVFHAERAIDFVAQKIGQAAPADALDDLRGEQHAHTLVFHIGTGREEERGRAGGGDELLQWRVALPQGVVFGQHIGQSGGVGEEMAEEDAVLFAAAEFRNEFAHRVFQRELFAVREQHHRRRRHGFRDGGEQEDRAGRFGRAEAAIDHLRALANVKRGGAYAARFHLAFDESDGFVHLLLAKGHRDGTHDQRASRHVRYFIPEWAAGGMG